MQVELKIDSACVEPKVIIATASVTEEVNWILKRLSEEIPQVISGKKDEKIEVLDEAEIIRVYAQGGRVFAVTDKGNMCCASGCTRRRRGWTAAVLSVFPIRRSLT